MISCPAAEFEKSKSAVASLDAPRTRSGVKRLAGIKVKTPAELVAKLKEAGAL